MKLAISHAADVIGHRITIKVDADDSESIQSVETDMDGFSLGNDVFDKPQAQYSRTFTQVGGVTPGMDHVVELTGTNDKGIAKSATVRWTD